ncbi:hypothetical protein T484DRAFT_3423021 [Baffinella frigidus]|nr:hypothetical protein T484DRAFT_3423021 [Cryptophyta sp. CCMP2293]
MVRSLTRRARQQGRGGRSSRWRTRSCTVGGSFSTSVRTPDPCTLTPEPWTLHPTFYTLHPTP